jgi:hypothetical protein
MRFEMKKVSSNRFIVLAGGVVIATYGTKGRAKRLADGLNRVIREIEFVPKSAGRRARQKGHQFEREVAILLREVFPKARRHLEYQDVEANGVDLVETGPFKIQCKKLKEYAPLNRIEEVQCDRLFGEVPVLITAGDGKEPLAALPLSDFIILAKSVK